MARYELIDCCPVPTRFAPELRVILKESGATLVSCYRADDAAGLLAQCGKHSQKWLYDHQGTPEQPNPANRPGQSTHELRSDGVAYRGPVGRRLAWWQVGIDIDDAHVQAFVNTARRHGWIVTITYPTSRLEHHHVNFRREPRLPLPALRLGSKGLRVRLTSGKLVTLGYLKQSRWVYGPAMRDAVRRFQHIHHLTADGIAGPHTIAQIDVFVRARKRARR